MYTNVFFCHSYHEFEGVDDVAMWSTMTRWCSFHLDLCEVQQPLPIGRLPRPIKLHLQVAMMTQSLPINVYLSQEVAGDDITWFQQPLMVKRTLTHLKGEDQQNPHIFHPLHGRLSSHMTTERGVAWLIDSVRTGWRQLRSGVIRSEINSRADVTYREREACRETITNMEMKTGIRSDCSLSLNKVAQTE